MQSLAFDGQAYKNFIDSIRSDKTRILYKMVLRKFMVFCQASDVDSLLFDPRAGTAKVIDFVVSERGKGLMYGSLNAYVAGLKKFYDMNEVALNWKKIKQYLPAKNKPQGDRGYRREEIRKILDMSTDIRRKIAVLLCCSAGVRIGAICDLKLKHLEKVEQLGIYKITVYEKAIEQYFTYCTPECAKVIDDYLSLRKQYGENLTPLSPLLRNQFDKRDIASVAMVKKLHGTTIPTFIHLALVDAGIRKPAERTDAQPYSYRYDTMQTHGFRKFFFTNLVRCSVEAIAREYLMGHKHGKAEHGITELMMVYDKPEESELLQEYMKAVDALTINDEHRLKRENVELIKTLEKEKSEWKEMAEDYVKFKEEIRSKLKA
jgi:integrase